MGVVLGVGGCLLVTMMGGTSASWFGEGVERESTNCGGTGELERLAVGEPGCECGARRSLGWVKRKSLPGICQNILRDTNMRFQPWPLSSQSVPTADSNVVMRPMRSSFGMRCRPLSTPSRLMPMRHSPRGFPESGVALEASVSSVACGSGWWKYQYSVTHSIMAIWRVGLAAGLESLLGLEMEEMKSLSFWSVGFVKDLSFGDRSCFEQEPLACFEPLSS